VDGRDKPGHDKRLRYRIDTPLTTDKTGPVVIADSFEAR
jgi:hypothetical protein